MIANFLNILNLLLIFILRLVSVFCEQYSINSKILWNVSQTTSSSSWSQADQLYHEHQKQWGSPGLPLRQTWTQLVSPQIKKLIYSPPFCSIQKWAIQTQNLCNAFWSLRAIKSKTQPQWPILLKSTQSMDQRTKQRWFHCSPFSRSTWKHINDWVFVEIWCQYAGSDAWGWRCSLHGSLKQSSENYYLSTGV